MVFYFHFSNITFFIENKCLSDLVCDGKRNSTRLTKGEFELGSFIRCATEKKVSFAELFICLLWAELM